MNPDENLGCHTPRGQRDLPDNPVMAYINNL
jgi:hypothetical protein